MHGMGKYKLRHTNMGSHQVCAIFADPEGSNEWKNIGYIDLPNAEFSEFTGSLDIHTWVIERTG